MKAAIFTCVTHAYEDIKAPARTDARIDYHCFVDDITSAPAPWQQHRIESPPMSPRAQSRYVKMLAHRTDVLAPYDITVYVDGSIALVGDHYDFIEQCWRRHGDLMMFDHPFRDCTFDEAIACARVGHASVFAIARQMTRYRRAGLPEHAGLFEANVIVRRRSECVDRFMTTWWSEFNASTTGRDQLSLMFAAWSSNVKVVSLGPSDPRFAQRYFSLRARQVPFRTKLRAGGLMWSNRALMGFFRTSLVGKS
jgi:hypothetical protein